MVYSERLTQFMKISAKTVPMSGIIVFLFVISIAVFAGMGNAKDISLSIDPDHISISAFYNGTSIKATGSVPAGSDVVIRITGKGEEVHLKKKGKVGGLLWMNTGKITFKNVPAVFMVYTTPELGKVVNMHEINLGYWSVKDKVEIEPESEEKDFLFKEFTKLKEDEGVYVIDTESVKYTGNKSGAKQFEIEIAVPPKMTPGDYTVEAYAVSGNSIVDRADADLSITLVGFPAWISGLAFGHELLYGIMAVIVAVAAGLVTGMIFKDKGGAH